LYLGNRANLAGRLALIDRAVDARVH
jgi:hypothetical protein